MIDEIIGGIFDPNKMGIVLGLGSVASGAYLGYNAAHGNQLPPYATVPLTIGPTVANGLYFGAMGGLAAGMANIFKGGRGGGYDMSETAITAGTAGAGTGALETMVGYTIGLVVGSVV